VTAEKLLSPGRIGPAFLALSSDLIWIYARWLTFKELFSHSEERIALLNDAAPNFFYITEETLRDAVVLGICRLADPLEMAGRTNLVLESLIAELRPDVDRDSILLNTLTPMLVALRADIQPLRDSRNRRIAHRDHGVALRAEEALPGISIAQVDRALKLCANFLNTYQVYWIDTPTEFDAMSMYRGAHAVVEALRLAKDHEACVMRELKP
jgi:hypothetical protein